jgi:hypothetical protein
VAVGRAVAGLDPVSPMHFVCEGERTRAKIPENVGLRGMVLLDFAVDRGDSDRKRTARTGKRPQTDPTSGRVGPSRHRGGRTSESASRIRSLAPLGAEAVRELGAAEDSARRRARRAGLGTGTGSGPPGALHSARAAQASPRPRAAHQRVGRRATRGIREWVARARQPRACRPWRGRRPQRQPAMSTAHAASVPGAEWHARQDVDTTRPNPGTFVFRLRQRTRLPVCSTPRCRGHRGLPSEVG